MKLSILSMTLFLAIKWCLAGTLSFEFVSEPQAGAIVPPGDFLLAEASQSNNSAYKTCSQEGLLETRGWVRKELYTLIPGSPRPSVAEIRRHLRKTIEALGGRIVFEGRCAEMDSIQDPRAAHVILIGLLPTPWGKLSIEVWPWEEGEALHCQISFILEDPMPPFPVVSPSEPASPASLK